MFGVGGCAWPFHEGSVEAGLEACAKLQRFSFKTLLLFAGRGGVF